jgi:hypothetical protein
MAPPDGVPGMRTPDGAPPNKESGTGGRGEMKEARVSERSGSIYTT